MEMDSNKLINIYKASAGSGKTYTLTHEYIDLILKDEDAYKHVLAVTFTNKATDEMKQRILEELYKMASDQSCPRREMARKVLIKILHDYPAFSVSTIDKFFQGVMRAFARELGRMITYSVELDSELVMGTAVDNLFADLDKDENADLLKWLIEYSLERIENGESWRIQNDIYKLSKSLFSEEFKIKNDGRETTVEEQMAQILALKGRIKTILSAFKEKAVSIGKRANELINASDLKYEDFKKGKNTPFNIFNSLAGGKKVGEPLKATFVECYNNVELWYAKTKQKEAWKFEELYNNGLNDLIGELIQLYENEYVAYNTALCVQGNLNSLGILGSIYAYILKYCKEKNVMLLSETTELLGKIIDDDDAPFIYEKIGTWINNFMLDEFQDTSLMQWNNFVPLLANSVANGEKNLVVGDVKQSIYRFRNSDWSILNSGIDQRFGDRVSHKSLDVNWRSGLNIVDFNNRFFKAAALSLKVDDIYKDFEQSVPQECDNDGYVNISFVDKKNLASQGISYNSVVEEFLINNVERLINNGYNQRDIGVLVRWNREGAEVAKILMRYGYKVVSADSLSVSSSNAVSRVVNILKWLNDPDNISMAIYAALHRNNADLGMIDVEDSQRLKKMPLYQMCEEIVRCYLVDNQRNDVVFLQSFLDMVLEWTDKQGSNLSAFLKWWDETGSKRSIASPQEQDAIQVMTVHKAKGLAFEAVILPYFCEKLDHSGLKAPLIWSNAASGLLNYDAPLPVRYSTSLSNTLFCDDYSKEKLGVCIDSLNVAYVAFTRPRRELIVLAESPSVNKDGSVSISAVSHLLYNFGGDMSGSELCGVEIEQLTIGEATQFEVKEQKQFTRFELDKQFGEPLDLGRIKTSLQTGSINDDLTLRDNGIIMHDLFARINTAQDVEIISDSEIKEKVVSILQSVEERGWFSDKYKVYKECSVIKPDGTILRPDRVLVNGNEAIVIDYKFGEFTALNKKYHRQVRGYMQLLADMGFADVCGHIWYVKEGVIEDVSL